MKHILIVDDDIHINEMLNEVLCGEGYRVSHAYSGTEAQMFLEMNTPDLVLLDLMLPGLSGEELLPRIEGIPVIVMSAKADAKGKAGLLLSGAQDYITKPFDIDELLARIVVQLRKGAGCGTSPELKYGKLTLDTDIHEVRCDGSAIRLTKTEFAILKILMSNPTRIITKTVLLDRISEDTPDCMESSLRVHVSNLRKKLKNISGRDCIESVWGIGFKMAETTDEEGK